jgi:hypothetical protein
MQVASTRGRVFHTACFGLRLRLLLACKSLKAAINFFQLVAGINELDKLQQYPACSTFRSELFPLLLIATLKMKKKSTKNQLYES